jgi:hypothetical protein
MRNQTKKDIIMPTYEITTVSVFRKKYVIEANNLSDAYDTILIDQPEELSQYHIDETVVDGRPISKKGFEKLLKTVQEESEFYSGIDNAHLGTRIIHKTDYSDA